MVLDYPAFQVGKEGREVLLYTGNPPPIGGVRAASQLGNNSQGLYGASSSGEYHVSVSFVIYPHHVCLL